MSAVQVAWLCAERPTAAPFAVALCEEQITCAHLVLLDVCGVGFTCARVLDVPRLLMLHCDSSSDQSGILSGA